MTDQKLPCVFCAIAEGKLPAKKVYEDMDSLAFLDINPRSAGMTIVMPKRHYVQMNDEPLSSLKSFQAAQNVAKMLKDSLSPKSVALAVIPSDEIPHFHIRLYPVNGEERPIFEGQVIKMTDQELEAEVQKIKSAKADLFAQPNKEDKVPDAPEMSKDDVDYLRKQINIA